jgi:hypothetical protein
MALLPGAARRTALLVLALLLLAPPAASAQTFFVSKSGSGTACTEAAPCEKVSDALTASRAEPGSGDEIRVGPGIYVERVVIEDEANDAGLTLRGAGRGPDQTATPAEATTLRSPETAQGAEVAVSKASGVTVEGLRVEVPAGFINTAGIGLGTGLTGAPSATVRDVHVQSMGDMNTGAIEVNPYSAEASIGDARIRHLGSYWGLAIFGPKASVAGADVFTAQGQALDTEAFAKETRIVRSRFETEGGHVATIRSADTAIDSSLFLGGSIGVEVFANFGKVNLLTLSNDTIDVGRPKIADNGGLAILARAEESATEEGSTASISAINSIVVEKTEVEGNASASVTCKSSIVPLRSESVTAGTIQCGADAGNVSAAPASLFPAGADWHLLPGSAAVDSGEGTDALTSTDLDGAPRIVDGDGDGTAVIDRGAFELPTPAPPDQGAQQPPSNAFSLGKLKRNRRKGTATIQVRVPGPGRLVLSGRKLKRFSLILPRAGSFGLRIVPRKGLARRLRRKGSARVAFKVTFTPDGGSANTKSASRRLLRRAKR